MGYYLDRERLTQAMLKHQEGFFSAPACADGEYYRRSRPFCLPQEHAEENLFVGIRETALPYFADHRIKWHQGSEGGIKPNNHLCSSQVCCVNFLFPFTDQPEALAMLLRPYFPTLRRMLPMEDTGEYVAFEWIGEHDYLGEKKRAKERTRGADMVSVLHISPAANIDLRKVTSRGLRQFGETCFTVWSNLQVHPDRFRSVTTGDLFGVFPVEQFPALKDWRQYLQARYAST